MTAYPIIIIRGGSWISAASILRASFRGRFVSSARDRDLGFRLVRSKR
jgi:formylglycine-generating enzyme required for sulfatase activity